MRELENEPEERPSLGNRSPAQVSHASHPQGHMPRSVQVPIALLIFGSLAMLIRTIVREGFGGIDFIFILPALLAMGLAVGHPFAWYITLLCTTVTMIYGVFKAFIEERLGDPDPEEIVTLAFWVSFSLISLVLLNTRAAKRYHDLQCGECGEFNARSAGFFGYQFICRECGHSWTWQWRRWPFHRH